MVYLKNEKGAVMYKLKINRALPLGALCLLLVMAISLAFAADNEDQGETVVAPHSEVKGRTLGEWSAIWWKWAYAIPTDDNPLLDQTGDKAKFGDVGPVFFLAGLFGPMSVNGSVTRKVTIPENKYIFFPLVNVVDDNVGNGCVPATPPNTTPCAGRLTVDQLFAQINGFFNVTALHASIDGEQVSDLFAHRETSPAFSYTFQLTDNMAATLGYAGVDAAGTVFPAVADGYYLMLRPLPAGQHVINFGGVLNGGTLDVTYQVTVTSTPSTQPAVLVP
jgi:hypothetical protein